MEEDKARREAEANEKVRAAEERKALLAARRESLLDSVPPEPAAQQPGCVTVKLWMPQVQPVL